MFCCYWSLILIFVELKTRPPKHARFKRSKKGIRNPDSGWEKLQPRYDDDGPLWPKNRRITVNGPRWTKKWLEKAVKEGTHVIRFLVCVLHPKNFWSKNSPGKNLWMKNFAPYLELFYLPPIWLLWRHFWILFPENGFSYGQRCQCRKNMQSKVFGHRNFFSKVPFSALAYIHEKNFNGRYGKFENPLKYFWYDEE